MTAVKAKQLMRDFLDSKGVKYDKLSAKTVSFMDLARDGMVFVKVHGINWQTLSDFDTVSTFAKANGFRAQAQ